MNSQSKCPAFVCSMFKAASSLRYTLSFRRIKITKQKRKEPRSIVPRKRRPHRSFCRAGTQVSSGGQFAQCSASSTIRSLENNLRIALTDEGLWGPSDGSPPLSTPALKPCSGSDDTWKGSTHLLQNIQYVCIFCKNGGPDHARASRVQGGGPDAAHQ